MNLKKKICGNPLLLFLLPLLLFTREVERVLLHSGGVVVTLARPIQLDTLALESGLVALATILLEDAQPYVEAIDIKLRVINCCNWERCPRIIFGLVAKAFPWGCSSAFSTLYRPGNAEWACCDRLLLA